MMEFNRSAFEAFHRARKSGRGRLRELQLFTRLPDGTYADDSVQRHWWTWQNAMPADAAAITPARIDLAARAAYAAWHGLAEPPTDDEWPDTDRNVAKWRIAAEAALRSGDQLVAEPKTLPPTT